jgi:hypothetical protein
MIIRVAFVFLTAALLSTLASSCALMDVASSGEQRCADKRTAAKKQLHQSSEQLRSVQFAVSPQDASQRAATGISALRTGLTTIRDHGDCFDEQQRAWAVQQLDAWDGDKAFRNVIGCYYSRQQTGMVPEFCDFKE